jgi:hypothetical protein
MIGLRSRVGREEVERGSGKALGFGEYRKSFRILVYFAYNQDYR